MITFQVSYSFFVIIWFDPYLSDWRLLKSGFGDHWLLVSPFTIYSLVLCMILSKYSDFGFTARGLASCKTFSFLWRVCFWVCGMHDPTNKIINKLRKSITPNSKFYWKLLCNPHFFPQQMCSKWKVCWTNSCIMCYLFYVICFVGVRLNIRC